MDLQQLSKLQLDQDRSLGFPVDFPSDAQKYEQIRKDLVGLFGEIGEFANVIKKITLKIDHPDGYQFDASNSKVALQEELADSLIYILRITEILEIDLQSAILEKMEFNRARYAGLSR